MLPTESEKRCNPNYAIWRSDRRWGCSIVYNSHWCTAEGGYGVSWPVTEGNLTELSGDGFTPWACPQCGCNGKFSKILMNSFISVNINVIFEHSIMADKLLFLILFRNCD